MRAGEQTAPSGNGNAVTLRIDRIAVEIADERRAAEAEEAIRTALALLADRLSQAPLGIADRATELALDRLAIGPLDPAWLRTPGAADRLADDLYRGLLGRRGV